MLNTQPMIYSLESRFKGALIGALLGENLAINNGIINLDNYQPSPFLEIAIASLKSIKNCYKLDKKSWLLNVSNCEINCLKIKNNAVSSQTSIMLLPVTLFYHENWHNLQENLQIGCELWLEPDLSLEDILIWGYLVKMILENRFNISQLIVEMEAIMKMQNLSISENLPVINNYIQNQSSLIEVTNYLQRNCNPKMGAIFQALYCFTGIPNDFQLCLKRALKSNYQPQLTATLTGILLGLHNSFDNISLTWRFLIKQSLLCQEILGLSENLFAVWAGGYNLEKINQHEVCSSLEFL